jgi:exopolyphosphatase/guanosine-5'-triphosphate,3'-diphosphate pyrophosphatase
VGSNSIRQVIADVTSDGGIRVVDEMKVAPRLGSGLSTTGSLTQSAMHDAAEAIATMCTLARQLGASRIEAVATSAVRDASNAREFTDLVRERASIQLRILSGPEEARLCFLSAQAHFEIGNGRAIVLDIGGGSLEVALSADGVVEHLQSLPLGAIRLTERFLGGAAASTDREVAKLRREVRQLLRESLPFKEWRGAQCIGSGGTFTNLAGIFLARNNIRVARSVHGGYVPRAEVENVLAQLQGLTAAQRVAIPGLNAGRADIIVGGLAVAAEAMAHFRARGVLASAYGIREGMLRRMARVSPVVADLGKARERAIREFAERCHYEERHASHVQELALRLFDSMGKRLGCEPGERQLLAEAALLHEVGYHVAYNKHHKHSYHLILHAEIPGMSPEEQVVVASVARYHRGPPPRRKHENFGLLDSDTRATIKRLSALLRLADGFDKGHSGAVEKLNVRWVKRAIRITALGRAGDERNLQLAAWGAGKKAGLLASLAKVPVEIVMSGGMVLASTDVDQDSRDVELADSA